MEAFVYRWRNCQTREWYIGYHLGSADDGYICSSRIARPAIESNPESWQRKILRFGTKKQMIDLERRILTRLQAKNNPRSFNRSNGNGTCYSGRPRGSTNKVRPWIFFDMIRQATGHDYLYLLFEGYLTVVKKRDTKLIKQYERLFVKKWGPLWFEQLGWADTVNQVLTEYQSKNRCYNK